MAVTGTMPNLCKYNLMMKLLNLSTDSLKIILTRSGFVFDKKVHGKYSNLMGTITGSDISFDSATKHIHTSGGNFQTTGFVAGGKIVVTGSVSNNGTLTISSVDSATQMTVTEALVTENVGATVTIAGADELATGNGYTRNSKTLAGQAVAQDNSADLAKLTFTDPVWTAAGGSIGPTASAIIFDDTSADKTILACLDFGGDQTAVDGASFTIIGEQVQLT